jgi:hypothetical protein
LPARESKALTLLIYSGFFKSAKAANVIGNKLAKAKAPSLKRKLRRRLHERKHNARTPTLRQAIY